MDTSSDQPSRLARIAPWAAGAVLLVIYGPVLLLGPVGEDLQWAFKGWTTPFHPGGWLRPFHQHLRPAGRLFFTLGAHLFGDHWWLYRLAALVAGTLMTLVAFRFLRKTLGLPEGFAAVALLMWLASPLSDEVFFVTNQVKQVMYASGVLLVLSLRSESTKRRWPVVAAALLAFMSKEEAVVLLPLVVMQDWILLRHSVRETIRRSLPWLAGTALYLLLYRTLVHFEAGWFYSNPWLTLPNLATTWTSFWHLHPPVLGRYVEVLGEIWPLAVGAALLTAAVLLLALRKGDRAVPFCFAAALVALAPTLPANLQVPRYTFLAYLFFTGGVLSATRLATTTTSRRFVGAGLALTLGAVAVSDCITVNADRSDWARYASLSSRLADEVEPVANALLTGSSVVVVRGQDQEPLHTLLSTPDGIPKLYFPRPDDPYGVTSVSAVLTWKLRREGLAAPRVAHPSPGRPLIWFLHEVGVFLQIQNPPPHPPRPFGAGAVLLEPVPSSSFDPEAFP